MFHVGICSKCMGDVICCSYNNYYQIHDIIFCERCNSEAINPLQYCVEGNLKIIIMENHNKSVHFNPNDKIY